MIWLFYCISIYWSKNRGKLIWSDDPDLTDNAISAWVYAVTGYSLSPLLHRLVKNKFSIQNNHMHFSFISYYLYIKL